MALAPTLQVLLFLAVARCRGDTINGYRNGNVASQFGELLKPPPLPPLTPLLPVPFHGGSGRTQKQNVDIGYQYQPPPPPPPPPVPTTSNFKFPAPFYKQYNFNFVPPPQPFTTTPSPSLFQKVSGWLFPSQQTGYDTGLNNIAPVRKDCNPCNLVPWIPVIRYDLGTKNAFNSVNPPHSQANPTYGPPSPTAYLDAQNIASFSPNAYRQQQSLPQLSTGVPHAVYGPPLQSHDNSVGIPSSTYSPPISTYGPPSPTHTILLPSQNPISSTFSVYHSEPSSQYGNPTTSFGYSSSSFSNSNPSYITTTSTPSSTYGIVTPSGRDLLNDQAKYQGDVEILKSPDLNLQLPKVTPPTKFTNSYGETISNSYIADIPYSVSATAAESTKIKTEVLPNSSNPLVSNVSLALANPAPFTLNRGRNIHTLQPVALPNLSVSPLPPIFNARPFRPTPSHYSKSLIDGINYMQQLSNNVKIEHSVPVAEFTHSIEYPATVVQAPIVDINAAKQTNQTKAYRNIPNAHVVNEIRDISSQASDVAATKIIQDSSFESTGLDLGNELYDSGIPTHFSNTHLPSNHNAEFADLRGVKDEDVDKYRTESNLQNIDSPLLYLKPSVPHKGYRDFILAISTPTNGKEYEIYDDVITTEATQTTTFSNDWYENQNDYNDGLLPPTAAQESVEKPKIVQIIVPYTTSKENNYNKFKYAQELDDWAYAQEEEFQARKIPLNTENPYTNTVTENYNSLSTTTENNLKTTTESYDSENLNTGAILNDLYDVKEPPFDIIKLQHTIDDWTEQEYSQQYKTAQKNRSVEKLAKQIPDDYFTTTIPSTYVTPVKTYDDDYDHEGSSSIQHTVTEKKNNNFYRTYNTIQRQKSRPYNDKDDETREKQRLHIYTAASSFRATTTTPAPWGKILTSISPLTKEKVYVVTSKPWREIGNVSEEWYKQEAFESKRTNVDSDVTSSDNLPFKSPRFNNRPALGFTSLDNNDSMNSESSYEFSKSWYQSINDLENRGVGINTTWPEGPTPNHSTNTDEVSI
ncbi:unnamed protein product [Diatraea saccharalis]|uniref:Uncharacterized protein n=1 Tax=Diatraea saccharalis TaxID=40085 RepID=A0A9N9WEX4_9NEOP|nr:unnamed protein product [Diatraea saccharalis]